MDFPASEAESPTAARAIAGPSRNRLQSRQTRHSGLKPYDRPSSTTQGGGRTRNDSTSSLQDKTGFQDDNEAEGGGGGLLSGLRQAIFSRPLSWLSGTVTKQRVPSSSSLPSFAQAGSRPRLAATPSGGRTGPVNDDIESHAGGQAGKPKMTAPAPTPRQHLVDPGPSLTSLRRIPSPARSSASAIIESHGRQRLSLGPPSHSPRFGGSTLGTPGYQHGRSLQPEGSIGSGMVGSQSSPSYAFGFGSERRLAGISSAMSAQSPIPPSPLATSSYNPLPSRSPFATSRRSVAGSSTGGSVLGLDRSSHLGGFQSMATPTRSRPTSLFGDYNRSRAGSVAESRMTAGSQTPKRREWSSLKLAPPRMDKSEGEELMQAYMTMQNGGSDESGTLHPALQKQSGNDSLMLEFGAGPSVNLADARIDEDTSLKRGASVMSVDGTDISDGKPRKRQKQMVWDAEMGFISREQLRARRPARPIAQNEAERLLNALEELRSPAIGRLDYPAGRTEIDSQQFKSVSVPLPVADRTRLHKAEGSSMMVSPYSRAMRERSKLSHSIDVEDGRGLKSKLRKPIAAEKRQHEKPVIDDGMIADGSEDDEMQSSRLSGMEEDEEEVEEPPRRRITVRKVDDAKAIESGNKTLRSGKVLLASSSPAKASAASSDVPVSIPPPKGLSTVQASKPMSRARLEISASSASAANRQRATLPPTAAESPSKAVPVGKDGSRSFQVLSNAPAERSRSSLRQGTEKMHRSHVKSGRVGVDEDEDDNEETLLPSAEELDKIKLPTNLFPQGFSFSGAPASLKQSGELQGLHSPANQTSEKLVEATTKALAAPSDSGTETEKEMQSSADNSLFARLGGFAPTPAVESEAGKEANSAFSFSSSAKMSEPATSSASKPLFSFQASAPAPPTSNFFSTPVSSTSQASTAASSPTTSARNDGPVPNFFASSLAKSNSTGAESLSKTSFSFGNSPSATSSNAAIASNPAPFSFSAPATPPATFSFQSEGVQKPEEQGKAAISGVTSQAPLFSFTPTTSESTSGKQADVATPGGFSFSNNTASAAGFPGLGAAVPASSFDDRKNVSLAPLKSAEEGAKTGPLFQFNAHADSTLSSSPFSTSSPDATKKRSAEGDDEPPAKKTNGFASSSTPSFSFGSNASPAKTGNFSFGTPKADEKSAEQSKPSFSFGVTPQGKPSDEGLAKQGSVISTPPPFGGFGSTASATAPGGSGGNKMEMMDTSPSSGFGMNRASSSSAFASSQPSSSPAPKPAFSFTSSDKPAANASTAPFTFESSSNNQSGSANSSGGLFAQGSISRGFGTGATGALNSGSSGGFSDGVSFGAVTSRGSNNGQQGQSPAPFTFGASSTSQSTGNAFNSAPMQSSGFGQGSRPPTPGQPSTNAQPSTPGTAGGGFSFSMPASGNTFSPSPTVLSHSGSSAPFVFGASASGTPPPTAPSSNSFSFGMTAPNAAGAGGGGGGAVPPQSPGGGTLFNIGAAPSPGTANRPVRGMPSRRKR